MPVPSVCQPARRSCCFNMWVGILLVASLDMTPVSTERLNAIRKLLTASDPEQYPDAGKGKATNLEMQVYIISLDSISETDMQFSLTTYWRTVWYDNRLKYKPINNSKYLHLPVHFIDKIWIPDTVVENEVRSVTHHVLTENIKIDCSPSGRMYFSIKVSQTLTCIMSLRKFPFDSQVCSVIFTSYGHDSRTVHLNWRRVHPVLYNPDIKLPEFILTSIRTYHSCSRFSTGNYSQLVYQIYLQRKSGFYLTKMYLPTMLVVFLSWLSFWLEVESVPARISLGLLTVLTMTTMSADARATLPQVSYIKAIDVWVGVCLFFVFAALIEFAYVNVTARFENWFELSGTLPGWIPFEICGNERITSSGSSKPSTWMKGSDLVQDEMGALERAKQVDGVSKILFPLVFLFFNFFYWTLYLGAKDQQDKRYIEQPNQHTC